MNREKCNPAGFDFTNPKEQGAKVENEFINLFNRIPKFKKYNCQSNLEYLQNHPEVAKKLMAIYSNKLKNKASKTARLEIIASEIDKKFHTDCIINNLKDNSISFVDVKGIKKKRRTDKEGSSDIQWLEYVNEFGYPGWVKSSKTVFNEFNLGTKINYDYVVFECEDVWILCDKEKLSKLSDQLFNKYKHTLTNECPDECYVVYNRIYNEKKELKPEYARHALTMKVPIDLLKSNATFIIKKDLEIKK